MFQHVRDDGLSHRVAIIFVEIEFNEKTAGAAHRLTYMIAMIHNAIGKISHSRQGDFIPPPISQ